MGGVHLCLQWPVFPRGRRVRGQPERIPVLRLSGMDPEEGVQGLSIFESFYPASRSFNVGLDLQF